MMEITSVNNPLIQEIQRLQQKKHRYLKRQFLVEGYHLVEEAYKTNNLELVFATNPSDFKYPNVKSYLVNQAIINKLSSTDHPQPIIGVVKMMEYQKQNYQKILLLDDIQDPGNLGTIIRTAAAFGIDAIYTSETTVDLYNEKVIRSTQGALFKIPIFQTPLLEVIQEFENKIPIYATALQDAESIVGIKPTPSFAIIMGSEARGVSLPLLKRVKRKVYIPMENQVESLNVAIATSILLYHFTYM